jgi:Bacterial Ig-like domain
MRFQLLIAFATLLSFTCISQPIRQTFVATDITHFWEAYDTITTTKDTVVQLRLLNEFYLDKASPGLNSLTQVRNYTPQQYIAAINNYPKYWQSIRHNTNRTSELSERIELYIQFLKNEYPELKPATVYFGIGVFRTGGTAAGDQVLIGSEISLTDKNANTSEFPPELNYLTQHIKDDPIAHIPLLVVHEYIHTQQNELVENLLLSSLYEGVAEFVSTKVTGLASTTPAIEYGKSHAVEVRKAFERDMYRVGTLYDWLWSSRTNQFGMRDLGYYVGYEICERYYNQAKDKKKAIKEMIELDYANEKQVERFIDKAQYFTAPVQDLFNAYQKIRPTVIDVKPLENGSKNISPSMTQITITFSEPMDKNYRGFDFGPLGEKNILKVKRVIGFADDGKSFTYEVELQPNHRYQALVTNSFRNLNGVNLKPYLIDFRTTD